MIPQDGMIQPGYKIYREHTASVLCDRKATKQGMTVTAQSDADGSYTYANLGTEEGWQFWEKNTRELGAWAVVVPVVMTAGGLLPVASQALGSDASYTAKTINTSGTHTVNSVVPVDGNVPAVGDYGLVVQCLEDESFELIYYPIGSSVLKVDHKTEGDLSSVVVDVKADGTLDLSNVGSFQDVFYVMGNYLTIWTGAYFHMPSVAPDTTRGPLNFLSTPYPTLVPPADTPYTVETKLAFDGSKWRWYTQIGGSGESIIFATVRWYYTPEGDFSEGEICTYDSETGVYARSGVIVWIDFERSTTCQHETAGNDTYFQIRLVKEDVYRLGVKRDLYECVRCRYDNGYQITHFATISKNSPLLYGYLLTKELVAQPWTDLGGSKILTFINGEEKENITMCRVPEQWNVSGLENYAYMEASDLSRGMPFYFRPITPVCVDPDALTYESNEKIGGEVTIAQYKLKATI